MQIDRTYIDERHVIPRYLADQLTDEEREAFEAYLYEHPDTLDDLEAVARLKAGLSELQRRGELDTMIRSRQRLWRIAIAAGVAAAVVAFSLIFVRPTVKRPLLAALPATLIDAAGDPIPVVDRRYVMRMRSGNYDAQIEIPASPQAVELRVLPEASDPEARYSIEVSRIDETQPPRSIGTVDHLVPDSDGYVALYIDASQLTPGLYELRLDTTPGSRGSVSVFLLHALRR